MYRLIPLVFGAALYATIGAANPASAFHGNSRRPFHDGRKGFCEGCHQLHASESNAAGPTALSPMLRGADATSTCLGCHAESGEPSNVLSRDGSSFTPAGDFYWLRKSFSWTQGREIRRSLGDRHGHNVVSLEYDLAPDGVFVTAPGGQFPSSALGCTSCHDPHMKRDGSSAASYRLLGGVGYAPPGGMVEFRYGAPVAVAPSQWTETDRNHVAYGTGMSEWCVNCHTDEGDDSGSHQHVVGSHARIGALASVYNGYVRTGALNGSSTNSYLALVPFEVGTSDARALDPRSSSGPDGRSNVMCLTCHRAHASAFDYAGRWDFTATFVAESHPHSGDAGATPTDVMYSYYGRNIRAEFGAYQRSFCNKCHAKD